MRRWFVAAILVLGLGALAANWHRMPASAMRYLPGFGNPSDIQTLYGNIDIRQVDLAFNAEGRIVELKAEEGDAVKEGQVLAVLDQDVYRQLLTLAEARRDAQRAAVDKAVTGSRPEEIARARADVAALKAQQELTEAVFQRRKALVSTGTVAQQAFDDARAALEEAAGRQRSAENTLALLVAGTRREEIEQAKAQLRAEEAMVELAHNRFGNTTLVAPGPGVVLTRVYEPGAVVLPNSTIYTVALTDKVWVRTYAPETMLSRIRPGMKVEIVTDGPPARRYPGWVGYISPTAEFTPKTVETPELRTQLVYRLRVHVTAPDENLRQGMPVTITWAEGADGAGAR